MTLPKFERKTLPTTGGVERRYEIWRFGRWHIKLVLWRAR